MRHEIEEILKNAINKLIHKGELKSFHGPIIIEIPHREEHGHFATNIALNLASVEKRSPRQIASLIAKNMEEKGSILEKIDIAGPGFINFWIKTDAWYKALKQVLRKGKGFGKQNIGNKKKVLIEFVSANPTGPLHVGHARGAALGDTLCRIMEFCGYDVTREFYINDAGLQVRLLGESIYARFRQFSEPDYPFPESGYHGTYVVDLAKKISADIDLMSMEKEEAIEFCAQKGKQIMLEQIRKDLSDFGVIFDLWFSEKSLYDTGLLDKALKRLEEKRLLYKKDSAWWIKTTQFGDDKDRVVRKSDGQFTYFASDIAYHMNKKKRGFDQAINIWGADHHGYIPRLKAALMCQDIPERWLKIILIQLVKLWREGKEVKMSKRTGEFVTFKELMDEVGKDAMRFVFLTKSHDTTLDFDIDLVKRKDAENPVYYVQYAHARICSIFRKAREKGIIFREPEVEELSLLRLPEEMELIRSIIEFPHVLKDIVITLEPHKLTYYLTSLASIFHRYFNLGTNKPENRIIIDNRKLAIARLALSEAARIVIHNGLHLLGVNAPEKM